MVNSSTATIREIKDSDDLAWPTWVELYLSCFPDDERIAVEYYLDLFAGMSRGTLAHEQVLILEQVAEEPGLREGVGMAFIEFKPELALSFLWYIATKPGIRNQGYGAVLYDYIVQTSRKQQAKLMLIEVEIPDMADEPVNAARRVNWYKRMGAHLLQGVRYFQVIGPHIPPKEMWLMVHLFEDLDARKVFALVKACFGEYISQQGDLVLA